MTQSQGISFTGTGQVAAASVFPAGASIVGITALDTSASANVVTVYEGTDATGKVIGSMDLAASKSANLDFAVGRTARGGIYVACTGAVKGTVWIA
jgi:hypothetical protein